MINRAQHLQRLTESASASDRNQTNAMKITVPKQANVIAPQVFLTIKEINGAHIVMIEKNGFSVPVKGFSSHRTAKMFLDSILSF